MNKNYRNNESKSIEELIKLIVDSNKLNKGLNNVRINELWKEQMGQGVASYTSKINLQGEVLVIQLTSSVLREELSYGKEKIIKMLNEALGEDIIKKIRLV